MGLRERFQIVMTPGVFPVPVPGVKKLGFHFGRVPLVLSESG
jgi:hypothetical protein